MRRAPLRARKSSSARRRVNRRRAVEETLRCARRTLAPEGGLDARDEGEDDPHQEVSGDEKERRAVLCGQPSGAVEGALRIRVDGQRGEESLDLRGQLAHRRVTILETRGPGLRANRVQHTHRRRAARKRYERSGIHSSRGREADPIDERRRIHFAAAEDASGWAREARRRAKRDERQPRVDDATRQRRSSDPGGCAASTPRLKDEKMQHRAQGVDVGALVDASHLAPRLLGWHVAGGAEHGADRKSTRLNSSHQIISYAVFWLKQKNR